MLGEDEQFWGKFPEGGGNLREIWGEGKQFLSPPKGGCVNLWGGQTQYIITHTHYGGEPMWDYRGRCLQADIG